MGRAEPSVAVVGAGLAGLAAAWELKRCGIPVVVFERASRPGGRACSERHEGFVLEPLSSVLSAADRELLGWIAGLGVQDALLPLRPALTAQVHHGRVSELDPRRLRDFARIRGVRRREGLRLVRLPRLLRRYGVRLDSERPEQGAPLDDRSLADFGRLYFGRSVLDYWLAPFVTSVSLGDASQTSRVHYLLRHLRHFGARRGLPRAALTELAEAAAEQLPTLYEAEVTGLESGRDGRLLLTYTREDRGRMLELRAVIVATPAAETARVAAPLLTSAEREALEAMRYTPSVALAVGACRPLSWHPVEIRVPHAEGSLLEVALLEPGMIGGRVPDGYGAALLQATSAWSAQARRLPDETVEKELLDALEWIQPAARAAVDFARVLRSEAAWPRFDVGHYRALARLARIGGERRREGRRVYLAGDYRMEPSWNGAVASGLRAARELADDLGG